MKSKILLAFNFVARKLECSSLACYRFSLHENAISCVVVERNVF